MEVQQIEVTIGKDGNVKIHVQGVKGKKCLDLTKELEAALGGQVEQRELTHEANEPEQVQLEDRTRLRDS